MSQAIVLVADDNYIHHAQHMMVNCRREGNWDGDFLLIVPGNTNCSEVESRGIDIYRVPGSGFLTKFWVFDPYLTKWDSVAYLDCDICAVGDLHCLFEQLAASPDLPSGKRPIIAGKQDDTAYMVLERHAAEIAGGDEMLKQLVEEFPWVMEKYWNTSTMIFEPASIEPGTVERLCELQRRFEIINHPSRHGTDQEIIHIALFDRFQQVKDKLFCYWGLDELNARVPSESRGWRGDEVPVIHHFCRWYAPWVNKRPDMDAYFNLRLNRVNHEFYAENVAAFPTVFPRL